MSHNTYQWAGSCLPTDDTTDELGGGAWYLTQAGADGMCVIGAVKPHGEGWRYELRDSDGRDHVGDANTASEAKAFVSALWAVAEMGGPE